MEKIDTILYIDRSINEDYNDRYHGNKSTDASYKGNTNSVNWDDPKLWSGVAFGRLMQQELNSMGSEYSAEVVDFGKWVTVKVNCHNYITGRTCSKTFLVVFSGDRGNGLVLSTANKWRSISGYAQAVSYIKSAAQILRNTSSQKI